MKQIESDPPLVITSNHIEAMNAKEKKRGKQIKAK
jgi:hypothetical protein